MERKSNHDALQMAVTLAGGQQALADICGVDRRNINEALRHKRGLPARHVQVVSKTLDIPRHLLRRDLYPVEDEK
jgi:DNA-binding transcriptional regulator YdaS (Cro superfamily)